jgi:hypothetical protein
MPVCAEAGRFQWKREGERQPVPYIGSPNTIGVSAIRQYSTARRFLISSIRLSSASNLA